MGFFATIAAHGIMVFAMRETEDGVTVTIEDISWERVFLRVSYRA